MILKLEQDLTQKEIEVLVRYAHRSHDVERILSLLKSVDTRIACNYESGEILVNVSDIYYLESVDKKTFVYCEKDIFRTKLRLYQLLEKLGGMGFVQISKSCILNLNALESIRPLMNSRTEATLKNGEHLYISRKYLTGIKKTLLEEQRL